MIYIYHKIYIYICYSCDISQTVSQTLLNYSYMAMDVKSINSVLFSRENNFIYSKTVDSMTKFNLRF